MAFQFGFAADAGSDDEETGTVQHEQPSAASDTTGVSAAIHKLNDLVGMHSSSLFHVTLMYTPSDIIYQSKSRNVLTDIH
jgi:hypothetical protein